MKKIIACVLALAIIFALGFLFGKTAEQNKTRYYAEAEAEIDGNEIHFFFNDNEFIWTLGENEKAPRKTHFVLVMESNGTDTYADDEIIEYR